MTSTEVKLWQQRIIIIALLCAVCMLAIRACNNRGTVIAAQESALQLQGDTLRKYKDADGREHAEIGIEQADISFLKALHKKEIDSLTAIIDIKDKQIEAVTVAGIKSAGSVKPHVDTIVNNDTERIYNFDFSDKWLSLNGSIGKQSFINYQYRDSLVFTTYTKHKLFGKSTTVMDVFSLNPNTRLSGVHSMRIPVRTAGRFGVGPYVGMAYDGSTWKPSAGISLQYSLIRF